MKDEWWIDRAEQTAELLRFVAEERPWAPLSPRRALELVVELRVYARALSQRVDGRTPGWRPVLHGWRQVHGTTETVVTHLVDNIRVRSVPRGEATSKAVLAFVRMVETAARRHRKRLASGIQPTVHGGRRAATGG